MRIFNLDQLTRTVSKRNERPFVELSAFASDLGIRAGEQLTTFQLRDQHGNLYVFNVSETKRTDDEVQGWLYTTQGRNNISVEIFND